jgi:hypothetical protein
VIGANAEAAPATVSGERASNKVTGIIDPGKTGQAQRPTSQETCLDNIVHGRGVPMVRLQGIITPTFARDPSAPDRCFVGMGLWCVRVFVL